MSRLPTSVRGRGAIVWAGGALVFVYAILMAASFLDPGFLGDRVGRNVELAGESVAGLDDEDISAHLDDMATEYDLTPVVLDAGQGGVELPATTLGLTIDRAATAEALHDDGVWLPARPFGWVGSFFTSRAVIPRFAVDESALRSAATEIDLPGITEAREPRFDAGPDGVDVVAGTPGAGVDPESLSDRIADAAAAAAAAGDDVVRVEPLLIDVAPVTADDAAEEAAADAEAATDEPLVVTVGTVEHPLDVARLRSWLVLEPDGEGGAGWGLDESAITSELSEIFSDAGSPGSEVGFTVEAGQVRIVPGEVPTGCCAADSAERIADALRTGDGAVALDLEAGEIDRDQEWAESLGIVEEVATFTTTHSCCQNRVHNIHLIADATRGVVIGPGETFSLNGHVGPRTAEKGYLPAGGITNGVVVDQLGGGISQYTTTLFNAAFYAGLDFGEYQAHSIYFSRYPYGREATLSHPHPDLEIRNTSPYGVLIWPTYTDTQITITLYSTEHVDVSQTNQTTSMQGTCTRVRTERTRTFHDGRVEVDSVGARYRRREGENCSGESSVPTTTPPTTTPPPATTVPTTPPPPDPPPPTEPPPPAP
ncbi:MAG: VanW family protein [Acidimicrobiia bacterium]|nr:VanW family protein [Acidimicrobiia bacterium]